MSIEADDLTPAPPPTAKEKFLGYVAHCYTASGLIFVLIATIALFNKQFKTVYICGLIAGIIDATDGPLARKFRVREVLPYINGRKLDDIIDYLNYTFIPLCIIWQLHVSSNHPLSLPGGQWSWMWLILPMMTSLFAFVYEGVKDEEEGFFVGFPSYWNFLAFYIDVCFSRTGGNMELFGTNFGSWLTLAVIIFFSSLTNSNFRFLYPNRAQRWKVSILVGFGVWSVIYVGLVIYYPPPLWLCWLTFTLPILYLVLSVYEDFASRKRKKLSQANVD